MNLHITLETVSPTTYELKWLYWASGQLLIQNSQAVRAMLILMKNNDDEALLRKPWKSFLCTTAAFPRSLSDHLWHAITANDDDDDDYDDCAGDEKSICCL